MDDSGDRHPVASCSSVVQPVPKKRKIRSEWFSKFKWLTSKDSKLFCQWCIDAGRDNVMTVGKSTKSPKVDDFAKHELTSDHKFAVTAKSQRDSGAMAKAASKSYDAIRNAVVSVMKNVYFVAKEDLPKSLVEKLNKHCCFQGCKDLEMLAIDDRLKYSSYNSINDMLHNLSQVIVDEMLQEVKGVKLYALMIDESTDVSVTQTLMIYIRYVVEGKVVTRFLAVSELSGGTAELIHKKVKDVLCKYGLDTSSLIALGTDGASTMTGGRSGVTTRFKKDNPFALSDHCGAHRLALASSQAAKTVPYLVNYQETINAICKLFKYSPKQRNALKEIQELVNDDKLTYQEVYDTRWLSFSKCVDAIRRTLDSLLTFLATSDNVKAKCLQKKVFKYKFIANTYLLSDSLKLLSQLCLSLQKSNLLFTDMLVHARSTIAAMRSLVVNLDAGFHFKTFLDKLPVDLESNDSFQFYGHTIAYSKKQHDDVIVSAKQFLLAAIKNLEKRFLSDEADNNLFPFFEVLVPANLPESENELVKYGEYEITQLADHFGKEKFCADGQICNAMVCADDLKSEWQSFKHFMSEYKTKSFTEFWCMVLQKYSLSFPSMSFLGQIYMCLPSTTVDVERGFSRHNLVKTSVRSNLKTESVNELLMIKIEGPCAEEFDFERCYIRWVNERDRRIFLPSVTQKVSTNEM